MMEKQNSFQNEPQRLHQNDGGKNDLQIILSLIMKNWYWFLLAASIALFCVRLYVKHTLPVYHTSTAILINETEDNRSLMGNAQILQGLGLPGGMRNLQNQIMILKSFALTETTLKELPFEIEFYSKGLRNRVSIYPVAPLRIVYENEIPLPRDTEVLFNYLGNNRFTIVSESDYFPYQKTASFGDTLEIQGENFMIECRNEEWFKINYNKKLYFTVHSRTKLIRSFAERINVQLMSREGSVLVISMYGTNRAKDMDFLNKHIEGFQAISLNQKNTEAERRIQFIDDQIVGISDSLSITENRLQQFRSSHRVMDLSAQGQAIIQQVTELENERARLNLEANYHDYLADYLAKDETGEMPIIPITMGITDPGLTRLVEELAELQGQLSARGAGVMNPLQRNLEQRVRNTKDALRETLNGLRRANSLARSENQEQINKANSQASSLPVTERQLLGIERKFRLNDELFTFLLETRAEQEMQKASNRADSEIIEPADARFSTQVSPNLIKLSFVALLASIGITFLVVYLKLLFNRKLKDEDLRKMTDLPVVGNIPHTTKKIKTIMFDDPSSPIAEAFRIMRTRMQFFTKESRAPVILVTSAMPEEGKTFTAVNLASVYSLLGKRTILVGFDLRKPKIFQDFNLSNESGVSTWLIGKDKLQDIIQKTSFENLSLISAGPVPPNPSELTALEKTGELLNLLKERYDYIIVDSSPIGVISDAYYLASLSDACLFVVKPGKTLKDMFVNTLNEIHVSGIKGVGLVVNDIQSSSKYYGYGEKYGYPSDKKRWRKHIFKRKKVK
ncbi:MAG: polysaccharide biosynthesis tyrosine autokinase [Bacteroidales bacterium]|nr:polysaccharide biosynthesis tyrosine autokinase [Bacteroidales bacterium]